MKKVIMTAGPQGAGKSYFCKEEILKRRPEVILIERDAILIEIFGKVYLSPYTGSHWYGSQVMWERIEATLANPGDITMILDTWCGSAKTRANTAQDLRKAGADRVELWYFTTSEDVCVQQRMNRDSPKIGAWLKKQWEKSFHQDCRLFHNRMIELRQTKSAFDVIEVINPLQLTLFPYADLLLGFDKQ